jgi:hypothetical protein
MSRTSKQSVSRKKGNGVMARIFFLDLGGGRVLSANPDGSDPKTLVSGGRKLPGGLAVDIAAGHLHWTNMGNLPSLSTGDNALAESPIGTSDTHVRIELFERRLPSVAGLLGYRTAL